MRHPNPTLNRFIDGLEGIVDRERDQWKIVAAVEPLVQQLIANPDRGWLQDKYRRPPEGKTGVAAFEDNRITSKVGLSTKLSSSVSFRFGFTLKYDQAPAPIAAGPIPFGPAGMFTPLSEKTDTITAISLGWTFGK